MWGGLGGSNTPSFPTINIPNNCIYWHLVLGVAKLVMGVVVGVVRT